MSTLFILAVLVAGGWLLVTRYERHLDAQVGPWIMPQTTPRARQRRHRRPR